jgi:ribosome-binding protein aMBF1 (putative translation factor)
MSTGAAFDRYLNEQLSDPEFKEGFERKLANLKSFVELMRAMDRAREERHLSKAEVAHRMGRHPSAVSRLLSGDGPNPTLQTITELAEALDLSVSIQVKRRRKRDVPSLAVKSAV